MQATVQALLGLQQIDRHIFDVEAELARLPKELARRLATADAIVQDLETRQRQVTELRRQVKEVDDLTTGQRQRLRKLETEATRSKLDAALFASYEHEMRTLKRTINQAEEDGLTILEQVERQETEMAALTERLERERTAFEEYKQNWDRELAAAESRLSELRGELATKQSGDISAGHLSLYRRLLATRRGEAMAEVHGQICQGCYVEIPKNLAVKLMRGLDLVQCPSCDRILYAPL